MNVYLKYYQRLWLKFKRRTFQYSLNAVKNPKWIVMFSLARIQFFRSWGIYFSKRSWYQIDESKNTIFQDVDVNLAVKQLKDEGFYVGINLPHDILSEIINFSQSISYFGNANTQFSFFLPDKEKAESRYQRKFVTAHHFNPSLLSTAIKKIEQDYTLWKIAAKYLETAPILIETRLWWTFVLKKSIDESLSLPFDFHYDVEDYRFIKFMFYLKDVNKLGSPHVCVKGSHKHKKLRHQFSLTRETTKQNILNYYGSEKIETIYGKAGLGFVEDFYCFHRGTIPISQDRLILEVKFAMNNYTGIAKF